MTTIEAYGTIKGHKITWLYDGEEEEDAVASAKRDMHQKGLRFRTYILV